MNEPTIKNRFFKLLNINYIVEKLTIAPCSLQAIKLFPLTLGFLFLKASWSLNILKRISFFNERKKNRRFKKMRKFMKKKEMNKWIRKKN